jgi:hypothetical protein
MPVLSKAKTGKLQLAAITVPPGFRDQICRLAHVRLKREIEPPHNLKIPSQGSEGSCLD